MAAPTNLCRLCITTSNEDFKNLYDEYGQANGLYEMTYEYFHPKIVDFEKAKHLTSICLQCFRHIHNFHSFQASITIAQWKLIEEDKTICIKTEEIEIPERESLTQTMAIKVEEEEFIGLTPEYVIETECPQIMKKEFITLPDTHIEDSSPSTSNNYNQTIETLSIQSGGTNEEEDRKDNISLLPLEILDVNSASNYTTDDEIPLARVDVRNPIVSKTASSDQKSSCDRLGNKHETLDYLLAKWMPNIKCFKCSKTFPKWQLLKAHFKQHHPTEKFSYVCCSRKFSHYFIKDHLRLHGDPDIFKCSICDKRYTTNVSLSFHYNDKHYNDKHSESYKFPCDICRKRFISKRAVTSHQRLMHNPKRQYRPALQKDKTPKLCSKKDLSCHSANVEEDREDNSISPPPLEILNVDTGSVFTSDDETPLAQIEDTNASVSKTIDNQKSSHDQLQKNHETLEYLLAKWIPNIKCFKCSKSFPSWSLVKDHFKDQHPNEKFFYKCCSRKFSQPVIKDHLCLHSDPDVFKCFICDKRYTSKTALSAHNAETHTDRLKISCDKCGKLFGSKLGLASHQRLIHQSNRQHHLKIQVLADGRTAYHCQLCGETKYSKATFRTHELKIHGLKTSKVACTICGQWCWNARTFREHMASHEKKKLYKCAFCSGTYGTIIAIRIHRQRYHPLESGKSYYINIGEGTNGPRDDDSESESNDCPTIVHSTLAAPTETEDCGEDKLPITGMRTADLQDSKDNIKMTHATIAKSKNEDVNTDEIEHKFSTTSSVSIKMEDCDQECTPSTSMAATAEQQMDENKTKRSVTRPRLDILRRAKRSM